MSEEGHFTIDVTLNEFANKSASSRVLVENISIQCLTKDGSHIPPVSLPVHISIPGVVNVFPQLVTFGLMEIGEEDCETIVIDCRGVSAELRKVIDAPEKGIYINHPIRSYEGQIEIPLSKRAILVGNHVASVSVFLGIEGLNDELQLDIPVVWSVID